MSETQDKGLARQASATRRNLTILFADLSSSTQLAGTMEAEHYAELLGQIRRAYEAAIPKHGGTIVRILGDGVLAVFGYPQAQEDDGRRATEAALDLHDLVRRLRPSAFLATQPSLNLHTGIHSGLVLLQDGDDIIGRFELLGNAANIAARLSDRAARDEILVSEETLGPESHFFETGPPRRLTLEGVREPISVHSILARASVKTRFEAHARRGLTPFTGRQGELRKLERCLRNAMAGSIRHLLISAPAGVGKTRLAEEFLHFAASIGCRVHRGYCESTLGAEPMQPFLQMLRALFDVTHETSASDAAQSIESKLRAISPALMPHAPELLRALSYSTDASDDGSNARRGRPAAQQTIAAVRDLFAALTATSPLVLFVDDWQWADDAAVELLQEIRELPSGSIMLLGTTRDFRLGTTAMREVEVVELSPLSQSEAAQTIDLLLPRTDPFLIADIHRYSGGNPLFIEELCHSAAHEDMDRRLVRMHGGAAWLNVLIESRLARLPEAQGELVRAAAVIGNVVPAWLLESITGYAHDHALVQDLAEQDFIFPGEAPGTLRFKHGITRDVIYDSVGLHRRRAMHLRIAEALRKHRTVGEQEEAFEALAYHYGAGGQLEEAARYAELAGDKAVATSALDRAKTQYKAALAALDTLQLSTEDYLRWNAISQRLGLVCVFDASRDDLVIFQRAVELASATDDQAALAKAQYWLAFIYYSLGESREAIHHCELSLAAAQSAGDDPLAVQIRATLGQAHTAACDYRAALPLLDGALAVKRQHRSGTRPNVGTAFTLVCKAWILGDRGQFSQAYECIDEALQSVRGITHEIGATIRGWHSAILLWQGRWEEAGQAAADSSRIAEQTHSLFQFSIGRALGGYAHWMMQRDDLSLDLIRDATSWIEVREGGLFRSLNHGWLTDGMVGSGRFDAARQHAARALMRARKRDLIGVAMAYRALARAAAASNDIARAQHYLAMAIRTAQARDSAHELAVTQLCEAGIRHGLGERLRARDLLDEAMPALDRMQMPWHLDEAAKLRRLL